MEEKELSKLTRETAEWLFGPPKKGEGAYEHLVRYVGWYSNRARW
jgi:hypothetical protein